MFNISEDNSPSIVITYKILNKLTYFVAINIFINVTLKVLVYFIKKKDD